MSIHDKELRDALRKAEQGYRNLAEFVLQGPYKAECLEAADNIHKVLSAPPPPVLAPIPAEFEQLGKFYQVTDMEALVRAQEGHIQSLQAKLPPIRDTEPRRVREG